MTTQPKRSLPRRHPHRPSPLVSCPVISMLSATALLTRSQGYGGSQDTSCPRSTLLGVHRARADYLRTTAASGPLRIRAVFTCHRTIGLALRPRPAPLQPRSRGAVEDGVHAQAPPGDRGRRHLLAGVVMPDHGDR